MVSRVAAVAACATLVVGSSAQAALVLSLDGSRTGNEGEPGDDRFLTSASMVDATQILANAGFDIATTDRFTAANIGGASVLYTGAVDTDFTAQELTDIESFVRSGGGLIMQRDWGDFYPAADPLAAVFGATYGLAPEGPPVPRDVVKIMEHPIWSGVGGSTDRYLQQFSASISFDGDVGGEIIGAHVDSGNGALAVREFGLGRVVFLTDMDAWDSLGDDITPMPGNDNGIVWENMFLYAAPGPGALPLFAMTLLGRGRRRALV